MGGMFLSPFLSTGGAWKWSVETEWNGQDLTAEIQRKEVPRTRAQTNAIVVNAQWVLQSDCRGALNKEGIAIRSPPQLDSFPQFNMTKTEPIFPNSGCHTGPCATLNRVSIRVLACLLDWQRLVTWIQTLPLCSPFYISHRNICPISAFPSAWNIQHLHERNSFPEKPQSTGIATVNHFQVFTDFHWKITGFFFS